jgi:hypothetical protein
MCLCLPNVLDEHKSLVVKMGDDIVGMQLQRIIMSFHVIV